jgi:hypothetical protein
MSGLRCVDRGREVLHFGVVLGRFGGESGSLGVVTENRIVLRKIRTVGR